MKANLKVYRYDPEAGGEAKYQDYSVDVADSGASVLDALLRVREDVDGTLSMRCSCRSAICGSCSMVIDGQSRLACKTLITQLEKKDGQPIVVQPMNNMPVVKDLVVDMTMFWDKVKWVQPWLYPKSPTPAREYLVSNEAMIELTSAMNCIMCGACVSSCTVMEIDKSFIGPAALAKAFRFAHDPRDSATKSRLELYNQPHAIWDCTRCFQCVQVCPKEVAPMEKIMALRKDIVASGMPETTGARHTKAFAKSIYDTGHLDEIRLTVRSFGMFNVPAMLKLVPVGMRAMRANKMPHAFPKAIASIKSIRRIVDRLEEKKS